MYLFSLGAIALTDAQFSEGNIPVSISSLSCIGNEPTLQQCSVNIEENVESCGRFEDAGIICQGMMYEILQVTQFLRLLFGIAQGTSYENCTTGSVRLADMITTNTTAEGRVEVCINQAWGTVCNRRFDDDDAGTVCVLAGGYSRRGKA